MTDRELMQQALEALDAYSWEQVQVAANALRDRLGQPKTPEVTPEVIPHVIDCPRCGHCCPPRPWVGLTDEDIENIGEKTVAKCSEVDDITGATAILFAKNLESKLREKNT